jgi:hypothetical protein
MEAKRYGSREGAGCDTSLARHGGRVDFGWQNGIIGAIGELIATER